MAAHHMRKLAGMRDTDNVEVIAVCDVYERRLDRAAEFTGGRKYKDYRRLLENKDIDYVLIATPEHWHHRMTLDAADAGKHIYCEKPMTQRAGQSKEVVERIEGSGLKMQVGVQGMSDDCYETANRYVSEGRLGKVVLAQIDYSRNYLEEFWNYDVDAGARPGVNLDWEAWLGPAPKRDYDPLRYFRWRHYWDYSSGIASDLFVHRVTRIIRSLGLRFPNYGVGTGGKFFFKESPAEVPDTFNILLDYPDELSVQLISSMANGVGVKHMLRGHRATLYFNQVGFEIRAEKEFRGEVEEVVHWRRGAEAVDLHHRNLQNAIRQGEELKCDCRLGYYGVVACELGTQSYRSREYLAWDAGKEEMARA